MNDSRQRVVVVGAGHAGGTVAALLRQYGFNGWITLIGGEAVPPYQHPPLSKVWLKGDGDIANLLLRPAAFYAASRIDLRLSCRASAINRSGRTVELETGEELVYDRLVLATGSRGRSLPVPGNDLAGVVEVRTLADADRLRMMLRPGTRLVIIGAGYIGLEVAASVRMLGASVVVIEREARVMARVASEPLSEFLHRRHVAAGVRIVLNATVEAIEGRHGHVAAVRLLGGEAIPCDVVVIGIGVDPDDALARAAGIACSDGIVVDLAARTSDSAIHAIGDCTQRPLQLYGRTCRLESVPNALEQAKQAATHLSGRPPPVPEVPWFWSDQYDTRLQIAGLPFDVAEMVVRGDPHAASFAIFHLSKEGAIQAVEAVNAPAEFMGGRLMIAGRKRPTVARLRNLSHTIYELAGLGRT
jgi:3-phenylpropionate/trans-cinnamate dioxygenase ferredoxin reductase subunit